MSEPLLPHSVETERGFISCLMRKGGMEAGMNAMAERGLRIDAFYLPSHRSMFEAIEAAWQDGRQLDNVTLTQALRTAGELENCGGAFNVSEVFTAADSIGWIPDYADILLEQQKLRELMLLSSLTLDRCRRERDDVWKLVRETGESFADLARATAHEKPKTLGQLLADKIDRFQSGEPDADLLKVGLEKLDLLSPVHRGDMPVISGEAKAGKSALAMTLATNMALNGASVGYATLEMAASEQVDRLLHGTAKVPTARDHAQKLLNGDMDRLTVAVSRLAKVRMDIRDDLYDLSAILSWGRSLKSRWPDLGALFVDYVQLVRGIRRKGDTREMEVAGVSRALRLLAMELRCAVFPLSQLNKDGDTRESMALEQDTTALWKITLADNPRIRTVAIPRQRNGDSGVGFKVAFLGEIARVENLSENEQ